MNQTRHHSRLLLIGLLGLTALIACQKPDEIVSDSTPDAFNFANKTGVGITGTNEIESEPITINGINAPAAVTVNGGKYGIEGAACTAAPGTINNAQKLRLCVARPKIAGAENTVTVTVGGISSTFKAIAEPPAPVLVLTPANFTPQFDVSKSATQTSNELTVSGLATSSSVPVSLSAPVPATAKLFVNGIEKTSPSSVKNTDKIKVSITSASTDNTVSNVSIKVGEVGKELTATYNLRTAGPLAANEFAPLENVVDYVPPPADYRTVTNSTTAPGLLVADTSPTCRYGLGGSVGPWRKATVAEILAGTIDLTVRNEDRLKFMKTARPKTEWNACPENWDENAIAASGNAGLPVGAELRKFGKTVINFNVTGVDNVSKVELKVKLAHESRADLLLTLVSPNGTRVIVYDLARNWRDDDNLRNTQFSNPNYQNRLNESAGISVIFDDAATPPALDPGVTWQPTDLNLMATVRYRCGPNDWRVVQPNGSLLVRTGNNLGTCWDNANRDGKSNFPGLTGFGSFGRVKPSNPLSAFVGVPKTGTWKLEIEDRAPGNQENNDDAFPPNRPLALATLTDAAGKSVTGVAGDDKELVRQPTQNANNTPKLRVAILTVK